MFIRFNKIMILVAIMAILLLFTTPIYASSISLEGQIVQGRFLVPMRGIFEALGATVHWDGDTRTVTGTKGDISVKLTIDSKITTVNDQKLELDVPATVIEGRTYVPARFISESLGANVSWDGENRIATIIKEEIVIRVHEGKTEIQKPEKTPTTNLIGAPYCVGLGPGLFCYDRNTVDGITLIFLADNLSGKIINYYTLKISTYNPVGDPSYDRHSGKSVFYVKYVGPVQPGGTLVMYNLFTYQSAIHKIVIDEIILEFSDGTKATQPYGYSTTDGGGMRVW